MGLGQELYWVCHLTPCDPAHCHTPSIGVPAHTVHLCGEPTTVPLVKKLVDTVNGGEVEVGCYLHTL